MITINLMGGLGNQLFQIFALISLCLSKKISFKLPINKRDIVSPHNNNCLRPTYWDSIFKYIKMFTIQFENTTIQLKEPSFNYNSFDNLQLNNNNNYKLLGYFQSYKYFENNYNNINKLLRLDQQINNIKNENIQYFKQDITSLHFRIGDYKNIQSYHPILDIKYYIKAIEYIQNKKKINKVLYFSEIQDKIEIEAKISYLKILFPSIEFIECNNNLHDWEQLLLMSCCQHNIIANSSFSWWGAYLNNNPNKIVCYPSIWFGPSINNDTSDLFPNNWNKIDL